MGAKCNVILVLAAAVSLFAGVLYGQDSQSLGDLARQQRQKEQSKAAQGKDAKPSKVITNEDVPEHTGPEPGPLGSGEQSRDSRPASSNGAKQPAEQVKAMILEQKNQVAALQKQMDELNESIRFAPASCRTNCVQWNDQQREKQQRVERLQAQVEEEKKRLEEMQESARKQGYGSSVYEP